MPVLDSDAGANGQAAQPTMWLATGGGASVAPRTGVEIVAAHDEDAATSCPQYATCGRPNACRV